MKVPEILHKAQRQYRHNFGSEELISAFDFEETIKVVSDLEVEIKMLQNKSSNTDYEKCPACGADKGHIIVQAGCVVCEHEW